jgi:arsenical pump membrane protein
MPSARTAVVTWALLAIAVAGAIAPPWRGQRWLVPCAALLVAHPHHLVVRPLFAPVAFLLAAVPFAVLLEHLGFFDAVAARLGVRPGRLWVLGALVTTLLNLDTAVVLLTPLYGKIDRRLALQPVLLALVASSALPVSNLTNLIAASTAHLATVDFLVHLGPPSLVATTVAWFAYRRAYPFADLASPSAPTERPPLDAGVVVVVALVVVGFVFGREVGVAPWMVAAAATAVLAVRARHLPWRKVPVGTGAAVLALGALAHAAASHAHLHGNIVGVAVVTAAIANVLNNLPATLVLAHPGPSVWAVLLGVNIGPFVLVTGSLASLLWMETTKGTSREFTIAAVRIVGPAFVAALATLAILTR